MAINLSKVSEIVKSWSTKDKPEYRGYYCGNCLTIITRAWHIWFEQDGFKCEVHLCDDCYKSNDLTI